jgi:hypothetical protein
MTIKPLLSVSPETMVGDEHLIASNYQNHIGPIILCAIPTAACFFDVKFVIAAASAVVILALIVIEQRLFDLCIRLARANKLLSASLEKVRREESPKG